MTAPDFLYTIGDFWVCKADEASKGYEVYETGVTCSRRVAVIGFVGKIGLVKAMKEADHRAQARKDRYK